MPQIMLIFCTDYLRPVTLRGSVNILCPELHWVLWGPQMSRCFVCLVNSSGLWAHRLAMWIPLRAGIEPAELEHSQAHFLWCSEHRFSEVHFLDTFFSGTCCCFFGYSSEVYGSNYALWSQTRSGSKAGFTTFQWCDFSLNFLICTMGMITISTHGINGIMCLKSWHCVVYSNPGIWVSLLGIAYVLVKDSFKFHCQGQSFWFVKKKTKKKQNFSTPPSV